MLTCLTLGCAHALALEAAFSRPAQTCSSARKVAASAPATYASVQCCCFAALRDAQRSIWSCLDELGTRTGTAGHITGTMGSKHDTSSETLSIVSVSSGTASASRSLLSYQFPGYASTTDRTAALLQHRLLNQLWTGRWRCASAIVPFHAPLETLPNTSHGERAAPSTKSCNAGCACGCLSRPATVRPRLAAKVSIDQDVIGLRRNAAYPYQRWIVKRFD